MASKGNMLPTNGDIVLSGNYQIVEDTEWPAGIRVTVTNNTTVEVKEGTTLTIGAQLECDLRQVLFTGKGEVNLLPTACSKVSVAWFGAIPISRLLTPMLTYQDTPHPVTQEKFAELALAAWDQGPFADAYFNKAIRAGAQVGHYYIPAGAPGETYRIRDTVTWWTPDWWIKDNPERKTFKSIVVEGEGCGQDGVISRKTVIEYSGISGPAFNFRGLRRSRVFGFALIGLNVRPHYYHVSGNTQKDRHFYSQDYWCDMDWILNDSTKGVSLSEDHAGIAIDWIPTSNTLSKTGCNPDQQSNNEDYQLRVSSQPWSADSTFSDLSIVNFVTGITISPIKCDQQGDTFIFNNIYLENFTYGISLGQDQARACSFNYLRMTNGYCAYSNSHFGKAPTGTPPELKNHLFGRPAGSMFNIQGGQIAGVFKLFNLDTSHAGQCCINGLYTEACGIIGAIGGTGVESHAVAFNGCHLSFDDNAYSFSGLEQVSVVDGEETRQWPKNLLESSFRTPFYTLDGGANICFTGCNFYTKKRYIAMTVGGASGRTSFRNCSFPTIDNILFPGMTGDKMLQVSFEDCTTRPLQSILNLSENAYYKPPCNNCFTSTDMPPFQRAYDDWPMLTYKTQKVYVRPCIKGIRSYYKLGDWEGTVYNAIGVLGCRPAIGRRLAKKLLSDIPTREFTVSVENASDRWFVGDYCLARLNGKKYSKFDGEFSLTDWNGEAGQDYVPALKVTKVAVDSVTFEKLSPEVDLSTGDDWGHPSAYHNQWIAGQPIVATFDETPIARFDRAELVCMLAVGDWCQIAEGDQMVSTRVKRVDREKKEVEFTTFTPFSSGRPKKLKGIYEIYSVKTKFPVT